MLSHEECVSQNIAKSDTINVLKTYYDIMSREATNKEKKWLDYWALDFATALCREFKEDFAIKLANTILYAIDMDRLDRMYDLRLPKIKEYLEQRK